MLLRNSVPMIPKHGVFGIQIDSTGKVNALPVLPEMIARYENEKAVFFVLVMKARDVLSDGFSLSRRYWCLLAMRRFQMTVGTLSGCTSSLGSCEAEGRMTVAWRTIVVSASDLPNWKLSPLSKARSCGGTVD